MNLRIWKWTGLVVFVVLMVCVISYADKGEGKSVTLPDAVKNAVLAALPKGAIEKTKVEEQEFKIYAVILKQNDQESELKITPDGTVLAVETKVGKENIPDVVAKALSKAAEGAEIKGVEQKITYAVIKPVKLDAPETTYEAETSIDGKKVEFKVSSDGKLLDKQVEDKSTDDNDDDNGEKDKD